MTNLACLALKILKDIVNREVNGKKRLEWAGTMIDNESSFF